MNDWATTLDELVRARGDALVSSAYLLTGDLAEAEDLVQDALVAAYSRRRTDDDIRSAEAYVRRTIRNTFVDGFRRRKRWAAVRHLQVVPSSQPDDGAATPEHVPAHLDVLRALATLAPRERACVVLRFYEDMTVPQIAAELGLAQGSVKRYLSDSVKRLEHHLGALADAHPTDLDVTHGGAR
ncbi:SigE family RNA polymerase sigma factor [Sanguibacter sp. HDW7]|uniref:SigE family RNA polymerase sigma factor n=1 Tax=Sanguibacter sp. HDW7 TaxID=2714931 RepID=UPI00140952AE|nr:SigE family RNA polymerase sigma factor [Sanguibacter sp. HDW7]QIK84438.1 SigE family RNA polymerase sigma factor [Sanguibacter sp. HDW7]